MSFAHPNSSPSNHSDLEGEFFGNLVKQFFKKIYKLRY